MQRRVNATRRTAVCSVLVREEIIAADWLGCTFPQIRAPKLVRSRSLCYTLRDSTSRQVSAALGTSSRGTCSRFQCEIPQPWIRDTQKRRCGHAAGRSHRNCNVCREKPQKMEMYVSKLPRHCRRGACSLPLAD
jgi:hypothetical protein